MGAARRRGGTLPPMKIAILSREPRNYSTRRLKEAALARGHSARVLDTVEGTQGVGVILAESLKIAEAIVETLHSARQNVLIQKRRPPALLRQEGDHEGPRPGPRSWRPVGQGEAPPPGAGDRGVKGPAGPPPPLG